MAGAGGNVQVFVEVCATCAPTRFLRRARGCFRARTAAWGALGAGLHRTFSLKVPNEQSTGSAGWKNRWKARAEGTPRVQRGVPALAHARPWVNKHVYLPVPSAAFLPGSDPASLLAPRAGSRIPRGCSRLGGREPALPGRAEGSDSRPWGCSGLRGSAGSSGDGRRMMPF